MANRVNRYKEKIIRSMAEFSILLQGDVGTRTPRLGGCHIVTYASSEVQFSVGYLLGILLVSVVFIIFLSSFYV